MTNIISSEIALAYTQCKLKAYLLLFTDRKGTQNEYISILEEETITNREEYFDLVKKQTSEFKDYSPNNMKDGIRILFNADLCFNNLQAYSDIIAKIGKDSSRNISFYVPILISWNLQNQQRTEISTSFYRVCFIQYSKRKTFIRNYCRPWEK